MRPLSEIYRELVAAGATPEIIALAIEAYESGGQSGKSGGQSGGQPDVSGGREETEADAYERRKAWDRAYRARRRAEKSGGQSGGQVDSRVDTPSPPSSPPLPPLEGFPAPLPKTPPISPPAPPTLGAPEPRGTGALRSEAVARKAQAARWPEFRATYPKREGSQSWPAAERKYTALVASGIPEAEIIDGARRYAEHLAATGSLGTRFVKQALTWLNQGGWQDEYLNGTGRRQQSDLMDALDARVREAKARRGDYPSGEGGDYWSRPEDDAPPAL